MSCKRTTIAERFHALAACVRSFSGMNTGMDRQRGSLNEFFPAVITFIWSKQKSEDYHHDGNHRKPECIRSEGREG